MYFPFGSDSKADIIAEYKDKLYKIQCKFAHVTLRGDEPGQIDYIKFKTYSQLRDNTKIPYTEKDIDFFATMVNGQGYLIPIREITSLEQRLRFSAPKNGQTKNIMYADNYKLEDMLNKL